MKPLAKGGPNNPHNDAAAEIESVHAFFKKPAEMRNKQRSKDHKDQRPPKTPTPEDPDSADLGRFVPSARFKGGGDIPRQN